MTVTITLTPLALLVAAYAIVALMFLAAAVVDRSQFANPRYHIAVLIAVIWPWIPFQILYAKLTGRYLVDDIGRLKHRLK